MEEVFIKQVTSISKMYEVAVTGDFHLPDTCWKECMANEFLTGEENSFLFQEVQATKGFFILELILTTRDELVESLKMA